ncbi:unnamed protein product [Pleuronectes platessa]|uniref:Uncharacterized protein n=1 Tax=Pleuronectes platessa TaxID=8262 RepID=A0A9N7YQ55_PLEPL|nr:unnamed protein product [Pleuronectes platessa]
MAVESKVGALEAPPLAQLRPLWHQGVANKDPQLCRQLGVRDLLRAGLLVNPGSKLDVRLKLRLARLQVEKEEREREFHLRSKELELDLKRLDSELELKRLEAETAIKMLQLKLGRERLQFSTKLAKESLASSQGGAPEAPQLAQLRPLWHQGVANKYPQLYR